MRPKKRQKTEEKKIALQRIKKLFKEADAIFNEDKALANRYVRLARKIAMKYKVRMPQPLKKKFCKHCYTYLKPGINARVRVKKKITYHCLKCKRFMRFPLK